MTQSSRRSGAGSLRYVSWAIATRAEKIVARPSGVFLFVSSRLLISENIFVGGHKMIDLSFNEEQDTLSSSSNNVKKTNTAGTPAILTRISESDKESKSSTDNNSKSCKPINLKLTRY